MQKAAYPVKPKKQLHSPDENPTPQPPANPGPPPKVPTLPAVVMEEEECASTHLPTDTNSPAPVLQSPPQDMQAMIKAAVAEALGGIDIRPIPKKGAGRKRKGPPGSSSETITSESVSRVGRRTTAVRPVRSQKRRRMGNPSDPEKCQASDAVAPTLEEVNKQLNRGINKRTGISTKPAPEPLASEADP